MIRALAWVEVMTVAGAVVTNVYEQTTHSTRSEWIA